MRRAAAVITEVGAANAGGSGGLVDRDTSGVLWYYQGTGDPARPFAPRLRVGGGWNRYTAITGGAAHFPIARDASDARRLGDGADRGSRDGRGNGVDSGRCRSCRG